MYESATQTYVTLPITLPMFMWTLSLVKLTANSTKVSHAEPDFCSEGLGTSGLLDNRQPLLSGLKHLTWVRKY